MENKRRMNKELRDSLRLRSLLMSRPWNSITQRRHVEIALTLQSQSRNSEIKVALKPNRTDEPSRAHEFNELKLKS